MYSSNKDFLVHSNGLCKTSIWFLYSHYDREAYRYSYRDEPPYARDRYRDYDRERSHYR